MDMRPLMFLFASADMELRNPGASRLRAQDHLVDVASHVKDACYLASSQAYDCILLDCGLPDGVSELITSPPKGLRRGVPVILVSRNEDDRHIALEHSCRFIRFPYQHGEPLHSINCKTVRQTTKGKRSGK